MSKLSKLDKFINLINIKNSSSLPIDKLINDNIIIYKNSFGFIINLKELTQHNPEFNFGNGGSWIRRECIKNYKIASIKQNNKITYLYNNFDEDPKFHNYKSLLEKFITKNNNNNNNKSKNKSNSNKLMYIAYFGINDHNSNVNRPISLEIRKHFKNKPCVVCGCTNNLVVDHKNDLYDDPRVLNTKTQTIDDFQSLCNGCNLKKRQVCKKSKETGIRYAATNIPQLKILGIDFIEGDKYLNINEGELGMKGTYWYDPEEFMKIATQMYVEKYH